MRKIIFTIVFALALAWMFQLVALASHIDAADNSAQTLSSRGLGVTYDTTCLGVSNTSYGSCVITHNASTDEYTIKYSAKSRSKYLQYDTSVKINILKDVAFSYVIKDASGTVVDGPYEKNCAAGETITLKTLSTKSTTSVYYYAYITNIALKSSALSITVDEGNGTGSLKVGGVAVSYGSQYSTDSNGWLSYEATAGSNYTFWGFYKTDASGTSGEYLAQPSAAGKIQFTEACVIKPLFVPSGSAMYSVGQNRYPYLDVALSVAKNSSDKVVTVVSSGTAYGSSTSNFDVYSGVTLLIPRNESDAGSLDYEKNNGTRTDAYMILTLPSGSSLAVNGTLNVNAMQGSANGQPYQGKICGTYGQLILSSQATVTVQSNGVFYARGLITGSGTVIAKSGAKVYQLAEVADWRGGSYSTDLNSSEIFPFDQLYIQNIQTSTEYQYGSRLYGSAVLTISEIAIPKDVLLLGYGTDAALFLIESGSIYFGYDSSAAKTLAEVAGVASVDHLVIDAKIGIIGATIDSSTMVAPLSGAFDVKILNKATLKVKQKFRILPGMTITVENGGTMDITSTGAIYLYDASDFPYSSGSYVYRKWPSTSATKTGTIANSNASDGKLVVNGTLNVDGALYVSAGNGDRSPLVTTSATGLIRFNKVAADSSIVEPTTSKADGQVTVSFVSAYGHLVGNISAPCAKGEACSQCTTQKMDATTYYSNGTAWYTHRVDYYENNEFKSTEYHVGDAFPEPSYTHEADNSLAVYLHGAWTTTSVNSYTRKYNRTCEGPYLAIYSDSTTKDDTTWGIANMYRLDDYLWLNAVGYLNGAFNSANLSVTTYDANGNIVATNAYGAIGDSLNEDGVQIAVVGTTVYLVKAIPAKEIPDSITFSISYNDGTKTYTSVNFTVSLEAYSSTLTGNDKTLADKLLAYGAAAKDYFGDKTSSGTGKPSVSHGLISPGEEKYQAQTMDGVGISTSGATIYFDEALRLSVKYQMSGVTGVTVGDYTIVQVGMLVQKLDNWNMANVLTTDPEKCSATAYIVYNTVPNKVITSGGSGNHPNIENATGETAESVAEFKSEGLITFDLKAQDYKSGFAIRTYAVLQDKAGNYHCVYGKQYGYGLEAYINAMYTEGASSAEDKSFNNLLEKTWALAQVSK